MPLSLHVDLNSLRTSLLSGFDSGADTTVDIADSVAPFSPLPDIAGDDFIYLTVLDVATPAVSRWAIMRLMNSSNITGGKRYDVFVMKADSSGAPVFTAGDVVQWVPGTYEFVELQLPSDGTTGQVLTKASADPFDYFWGDPAPGGGSGASVLNGGGPPSAEIGADGDFYIDTAAWDIYGPKSGGAWGGGTSLVGPGGVDGADGADGLNGVDGLDGTDGRTLLSGSGAPGAGSGFDGDFYIDTAAWDIYGPKSGGEWGDGTSIIGPPGSGGGGSSGGVEAVRFAGPDEILLGSKSLTAGSHTASMLLGIDNPVTKCSMLLCGEGTVGSTVITDATGKTVTNAGVVAYSSAQVLFGGSSIYFDNNVAHYLTYAADSSLDVGSDDFAIGCLAYFTAASTILVQRTTATSSGIFLQYASGSLLAYLGNGSGWFVQLSSTAIVTGWNKILFIKTGKLYSLYVNNVLVKTQILATPGTVSTGLGIAVGRDQGSPSVPFNGYIRYLYLTKDVKNLPETSRLEDMSFSAPSASVVVRNSAGTLLDTITSSSAGEQKSGASFTLASDDIVKIYGTTPNRRAQAFVSNIAFS